MTVWIIESYRRRIREVRFLLMLTALVIASSICSADEILIGCWFGPSISKQNLQDLAKANFNFTVLDPGEGDSNLSTKEAIERAAVARIQDGLRICQRVGIKALVNDERFKTSYFGEPAYWKGIDDMLSDYSAYPALLGYSITDEPNAIQFEWIGQVKEYLLKKNSKHIAFVNIFPNTALKWLLGTSSYGDKLC